MSLVCLSSANCLQAFLCIIFRRVFLLGWQPCRPIWCSVRCMVWALTGWPPPPPPFQPLQQCRALIHLFPKHNLWIWCWARPLNFFGVLSGTCPVKPLYDLSHRAVAQFQSLGNLLIAYAIFMKSNNSFFQIFREFFAMRCHVELPVTSMREWER